MGNCPCFRKKQKGHNQVTQDPKGATVETIPGPTQMSAGDHSALGNEVPTPRCETDQDLMFAPTVKPKTSKQSFKLKLKGMENSEKVRIDHLLTKDKSEVFKMRARTVVINVEGTDEDIESGRVKKPRVSHASQIQLQEMKDKKRRQASTEPHKHEKKRSSTFNHNSSF